MKHRQCRPSLEHLESRLTPAFNVTFSPVTSTWTLTQVADNGPVIVAVTATNQLQLTQATTVTLGQAGANLTVTMLNGSSSLTVQLDAALTGNLTINLAGGSRFLDLDGTANTVGGKLSITGTTGEQFVELATNAPLSVGDSATIDLGLGDDVLDFSNFFSPTNDINIRGDFTLRGVNEFPILVNLSVGGNLSFSVNMESAFSEFDPGPFGGTTTVGGSFTYLGNNLSDFVALNDTVSIAGNVSINTGNDIGGDGDVIDLSGGGTPIVIGGNVTVVTGANVDDPDVFFTDEDTQIGGSLSVNLGNGFNVAAIGGTIGGRSITYTGGNGEDDVLFDGTASGARLTVLLGAGNDSFELDSGDLAGAYIDGGTGTNTFDSSAIISFPFTLIHF